MKRAKPGQRIDSVISANAYNRIVAATETVESGDRSKATAGSNQSGLIKVKNNTGKDLGRFAAVAIGEPIYKPESSESSGKKVSSFWRDPAVYVETLSDDDARKIAIMAEPVARDKIGFAVVSGITPAIVTKPDSGSGFTGAKPVDGGLELTKCGGIQVIWYDTDADTDIAALVDVRRSFNPRLFDNYSESKQQALTHSDSGCLEWVDIEDCE